MRAIIIGAGRGSRLKSMTDNQPKCYATVGGRRILDWTLEAFDRLGSGFAISARDLAPAIKFAEARRERDALRRLLAYFAQSLALAGREQVVARVELAERSAEQHRIVLAAMQDVDRNVSPALALESMIYRLRQV